MSIVDSGLTQSDKDVLVFLLEVEKASAYTLAKNTDWSYSTMFTSTKRLEASGLIFEIKEIELKKGVKKRLYQLSSEGKKKALGFCISAKVPITERIESVPSPLDDVVTNFLLSKKRETAELDFKYEIDIKKSSDFAKIAKHVFAMSNYGGGHILIGFKETKTGNIEPVGLPLDYHIDQAHLQEKFNAYSNSPIVLDYKEVKKIVNSDLKKFAVIYVPPSNVVLTSIKPGSYVDKDGKLRQIFDKGEILIRRGTQSVPATLKEIKYIEKRATRTKYQISLLTGKPDKVKENLFGNFFNVIQLPEEVFEAKLPIQTRFRFFEHKHMPFVRMGEKIYSFCDVRNDPIGPYIKQDSFKVIKSSEFFESQGKRNLLVRLLNQEARHAALLKNMKYDGKHKNTYFFPCEGYERKEKWEGRFRKSTRIVAKRVRISQLATSLYIHSAASVSFSIVNTEVYLKILPRIVLTPDGFTPISGFDKGTVKTRVIFNQYNDAYLNIVLFWISRFKSKENEKIEIGERIVVSPEPVTVKINFGIRKDRPATEFSRRKNELYSIESLEVMEE